MGWFAAKGGDVKRVTSGGHGGDPPTRWVARSEEGEPPIDLPQLGPPRGLLVR